MFRQHSNTRAFPTIAQLQNGFSASFPRKTNSSSATPLSSNFSVPSKTPSLFRTHSLPTLGSVTNNPSMLSSFKSRPQSLPTGLVYKNGNGGPCKTPMSKKRSLSEVSYMGTMSNKENLRPFDDIRPRKTRKTTVVKELITSEKRTMHQVTTGMHPELLKANKVNIDLAKRIRRVEEMATFWKRKSVQLNEDLNKSRTEISMLRGKLEGLESERLELQSKLLSAQQDSSQCMEAIKSLMSENEDLKFVVKNVSSELQKLESAAIEESERNDVSMTAESESDPMPTGEDMESHAIELEKALEDTLADLTDRLDEIEQLKTALAKTTVERDQLQQVVTKEVIKSAIANLDQDDQKEAESDPDRLRIMRLQGQVEKCMFRIALLSQKNEELKKIKMDGSDDADLLKTLEDSQKLEILESLCMQRYRKLLRDTAAELVEEGDDNIMNESF